MCAAMRRQLGVTYANTILIIIGRELKAIIGERKMRKKYEWVLLFGLVFMFINSFYWAYLFTRTYAAPDFKIIHSVNSAGEAHIELFLLIVELIIIIPVFFILLRRQLGVIFENRNKHKEKAY